MRFKKINENENQFEFTSNNSKHIITRENVWYRLGGEQYEFSCSCGWKGTNNYGEGKTNKVAEQHLNNIIFNK